MRDYILLTALLLVTGMAHSQPVVTIDGNTYQLNVDVVEMSSRRVFDCEVITFIPSDFDKDGDDDNDCINGRTGEGLVYDPCTDGSYLLNRIDFAHLGGTCLTKAEYEESQKCDYYDLGCID